MILLIGFIISAILYGAFPFLFAKLTKKFFSTTSYVIICFAVNLIITILLYLTGVSALFLYLIFTVIFVVIGNKILKKRFFESNNN